MGLIVREKHFRNSNSYLVVTSPPDRITAKETVIQNDESPQSDGCQSPQKRRCQSPQRRGCKGNPMKGIQKRQSTNGTNSAPGGTALSMPSGRRLPSWEETKEIAALLHEKGRHNPDSEIGIFPPNEILAWARKWQTEIEGTDGHWKGSRIVNFRAILETYLTEAANRQSKRFKEFNHNVSDTSPPPF